MNAAPIRNPYQTPSAAPAVDTAAFMRSVYNWMAVGLVLTGVIGAYLAQDTALVGMVVRHLGLLFIGELLMIFAFSSAVGSASYGTLVTMYVVFCAYSGVTLSTFFYAYTRESMAISLYVAGGTFAAMSAWGMLTKRDLSGWRPMLGMAVFGFIIAILLNLFVFGSSTLQFVTSAVGVVLFTALTAYNTQRIRVLATSGNRSYAVAGALSLYLSFLGLFKVLLILTGRRR